MTLSIFKVEINTLHEEYKREKATVYGLGFIFVVSEFCFLSLACCLFVAYFFGKSEGQVANKRLLIKKKACIATV